MAALAPKYGARHGGVPPKVLVEPTHTSSPSRRSRICGSTARLTRCVDSTLVS